MATTIGRLQTTKLILDRFLGIFVSILMAALVIDVVWQVFTRYALPQPSSFTDELARFLLIWVGLLGSAYAAGQRLHLAIDLVSYRLDHRRRHILAIVIELAILSFALGAMLIGGWQLVSLTLLLGQSSASLGIPLGYVYSVLPLSGLIISFYCVYYISEHWRAVREIDAAPADPLADSLQHATTSSTSLD